MKTRVWIVLLIFLMVCPACSQIKEYADIAKGKNISKKYQVALKRWTRDKTVHSQFETMVHIVATYKSREFNKAYLSEYSKIYLLTDSEKEAKARLYEDLASDYTEFLFYAYIPEKNSNDFSQADSIWKIFLSDGKGHRIYPIEVRKIKKITPVTLKFFPYVNPHYGMLYSLKFYPSLLSLETRRLKLVFASVLGKVELTWDEAVADKTANPS